MLVRIEPIHKTEEVILIDEIGRVITTLDMIDFFCEFVNNDLEPLIEDSYTFYSVDKRLFS